MVLESIRARGADRAFPRLSRPEFTLVVACAFWAAAMNRNLFRHLAGSATLRLRAAEQAFASIHAIEASAAVRLARLRLRAAGTPAPLGDVAQLLEAELAALPESVDQLIADFVEQQIAPRSTAGPDLGR
jgi:hypothetical protein